MALLLVLGVAILAVLMPILVEDRRRNEIEIAAELERLEREARRVRDPTARTEVKKFQEVQEHTEPETDRREYERNLSIQQTYRTKSRQTWDTELEGARQRLASMSDSESRKRFMDVVQAVRALLPEHPYVTVGMLQPVVDYSSDEIAVHLRSLEAMNILLAHNDWSPEESKWTVRPNGMKQLAEIVS